MPRELNMDAEELQEWLDSLEDIRLRLGEDAVQALLLKLQDEAWRRGIRMPFTATTPYTNTIPVDQQPRYPGSRELERRIKSIIRWNAMAMVTRANRESEGIGGHISTYASAATLYEVGFNHFFRARTESSSGDQIFIQGHASPGIYARAFLEGRITEEHLRNFRRELTEGGGLSSYPHPRLMPWLWEFPTVSMGLGPIAAIYQARFNRYLEDRGLSDTSGSRVWAFLGDGETDEPETLGAIDLAGREKLDNLTFVINANLQRLDGPVRGNGKIIQELEGTFRGAGWNVVKVIWGDDWDPLLAADDGELVSRMGEVVDGQYQKYTVESGAYIREHFFNSDKLRALVKGYSDEQLRKLRRGGHDPEKVYAAYQAATHHPGQPTVIIAKTIKGYGLARAGEGHNVTHSLKKLEEDEVRDFRTRFGIPISDEDVAAAPFYRPADDSPEIHYLQERRRDLGGYVPGNPAEAPALPAPGPEAFGEFMQGSGGRAVSTTMAYTRMLGKLLKDPGVGRYIVPIIPDEARTFGMEGLFRSAGIYSHVGQRYEPVDSGTFLYYKEATDGQILEEGITEAGSMASFQAAGTAHRIHGVNMVPIYTFYSMFGLQRTGDQVWAAGDARARGFLVGATAGRTTLNGEGLQHQDGHSHLLASAVPSLYAYDPAFAYEVAVIMADGFRRMFTDREDVMYYLTVYNENYVQPAMPEGAEEGILRGLYRFRSVEAGPSRVQLMGSGSILKEVLRAQDMLAELEISSDAWSVTSPKRLRTEALLSEREARLQGRERSGDSWLETQLQGVSGPFVMASDNHSQVLQMFCPWMPERPVVLGTDGYGRSDTRATLREFFEVSAEHIAWAALVQLVQRGQADAALLTSARQDWAIDPDKAHPDLR